MQVAKHDIATALRSKNVIEAFHGPTIFMAVKSMGEDEILVALTAAITRGMADYFTPEKRMEPSMCAAFAEGLMEKYPHEGIGDIPVFLKKASWASYGDVDKKGNVTNKGNAFGRLDPTRMMVWFEQFLDEKAQILEEERRKELKRMNEGAVSDQVLGIMKEEQEKAIDGHEGDTTVSMRVASLVRTIKLMTDDQLREAWNTHKTRRERVVILQEANERGLVQRNIENHLKKLEDQ